MRRTLPSGTSPLARGKHVLHLRHARENRNIPARAGKTDRIKRLHCQPQEHPRSRGENCSPSCAVERGLGTSPLARGKQLLVAVKRCISRNIPARAGKTDTAKAMADLGAEHPRSRGENKAYVDSAERKYGNIPARAGKTEPTCDITDITKEHPRSRGENSTSAAGDSFTAGTSPLARGKLRGCVLLGHCPGNIPARAGKTSGDTSGDGHRSEHPRSRGENLTVGLDAGEFLGTSPLARGKQTQTRPTRTPVRNIPARAGKTTELMSPSRTQ